MALNAYLAAVERLLHDPTNQFWSSADLTAYINQARGQVAAESQSVRVLPASGSGQNQTVAGQEVYTFASLKSLVQETSGVNAILQVKSIAVSWGAMKPLLDQMVWSDFQAYLRSYSTGLQGQPTCWAQYGQGEAGSVYLWPVPSDAMAMDWDCICTPIDLATDSDAEAIPYPWTDAIPFFAAYLAQTNAQRPDQAKQMFDQYTMFMKRGRGMSDSEFIPSYYG